jgi:hypothetical protein
MSNTMRNIDYIHTVLSEHSKSAEGSFLDLPIPVFQ